MLRRTTAGQEYVRRRNLGAVLTEVHVRGGTTRSELTSALGLNRSTIGELTSQLGSLGLVEERGRGPDGAARTGRPSHLVVPCTEHVTVLAVRVDVDAVAAATVGLGGTVLQLLRRRTRPDRLSARALASTVGGLCRSLLARSAAGARCLGVGVSVPGLVRAEDGLVRFAPNLGWTDEPFPRLLSESLGLLRLPVAAGNDADLGVLAEHLRGAAAGVDDALYLIGGVGVGGGALVGGVPLRGAGGYAGEVGHLPVRPDGHPCRCGSRGCWETEVGLDHLLERAGRAAGGGLRELGCVVQAADGGDRRAEDVLGDAARWTGAGVGALVNVLDPGVVVLGGAFALLHDARPRAVREAMDAVSVVPSDPPVLLRSAALDDSALLGAAELAFAALLADPAGTAR